MKAKRLLITICILLLSIGCICSGKTEYREVKAATAGDYEYEILDDGTAEITQYNGAGGNVVIPDTIAGIKVTSLNQPFFENSNLTGVTIPEGVVSIGESAFYGCCNLKNVKFPNSMVTISDMAFCGCSSLTEVTIPDGVQYIGAYAFKGCSELVDVVIPDSIEHIEGYSFSGTKWLAQKQSENPLVIVNNNLLDGSDCAGSVQIPDGVKHICGGAFYDCTKLTNVMIPNSVETIDWYAFYGCTGLTEVIIPEGVTTIDRYAFYGCTGLKEINIPSSVKIIGQASFGDTPWLEQKCKENPLVIVNNILIDAGTCTGDVVIPDDVTEICGVAFSGCKDMTGVSIPNTVKIIGDNAFAGCSGLTNVILPDGLEEMGWGVFRYCEQLVSITIPASVIKMGSYIFGYPDFDDEDKINPDLVIYTTKNSTAAQYASSYGIKTVFLDFDPSGTPTNEPGVSPDITPSLSPSVSNTPAPTDEPSVSPTSQPSAAGSPAPAQTAEPNKVTVPIVAKTKAVEAAAGKKKLILKWKKSSGVSGYQIQLSLKKNFKGAKKIAVKKTATTYTAKKLKSKKTYYIRIRAYKNYKVDGKNKTAYGKWTIMKKKLK